MEPLGHICRVRLYRRRLTKSPIKRNCDYFLFVAVPELPESPLDHYSVFVKWSPRGRESRKSLWITVNRIVPRLTFSRLTLLSQQRHQCIHLKWKGTSIRPLPFDAPLFCLYSTTKISENCLGSSLLASVVTPDDVAVLEGSKRIQS